MTTRPSSSTETQAVIVRLHGKSAVARLPDGSEQECAVRGRLKQGKRGQRSPIAVGDRVTLDPVEDGSYHIQSVAPRRGVLSRPSAHNARLEQVVAAHVDQVMITLAADTLSVYLPLVDRIIVAAAGAGISTVLLVNKCDLVEPGDVDQVAGLYARIGYKVIRTSAASGAGIEELRDQLRNRTSVFAGPSGAGKSSCLNAIDPSLRLKTGEVKESGGGRHTTTHVSLLPLREGGFVVDTPGVREFGLWGIDKSELALWYPDFTAYLGQCKYNGCMHTHEPNCAVKAAVDASAVDRGRYQRYLRILELWDEPLAW